MNAAITPAMITDAKNCRIAGTRIYLRCLKESDASETYLSWLNDPMVNSFLDTKRTNREELEVYLKEKDEHPDCIFFGIFTKDDDRHIGNIKLEPINFTKKEAVIGILIGDKNSWGKGICTEAIAVVVEYAFSTLRLHKICLGVVSKNLAAINCYKKAGFCIERKEILTGVNAAPDCEKIIMSIDNTIKKME